MNTEANDSPKSQLKSWLFIASMTLVCAQWLIVRLFHIEIHNVMMEAFLPGLAIFGAAYVLSWGAELLQLDLPQTFALLLLALIAVLPEYAVDMYFAWMAGKDPQYMGWATANMTGANRLLIGVGWPVVLLAFWWGTRQKQIVLEESHKIEFRALVIATLYCFVIPIKGSLSLVDFVILLGVFGFYLWGAMHAEVNEPELEGPTEHIAQFRPAVRRLFTVLFFLVAGTTIFLAAEPFAEGLLKAGRTLGIEEFILVQWLAPLASESPEFIVAVLFAMRGLAGASLGTLISSKVNQWTLLVGMLPLVFSLSAGHAGSMVMDSRQVEEIFLTAAQSFFALILIIDFTFGWWEALLLLVLFITQLFFTDPFVRYVYAYVYIGLGIMLLVGSSRRRNCLIGLFKKKSCCCDK
ncbi:MAG TPA: sodium:calcium antiporter [Elusimicrobiota bacterium]|nr:sodium:calcium antiporter [Elusimicrobiota bacterium]